MRALYLAHKQIEALIYVTYISAFGIHKEITVFGSGRHGAFHFKQRGTSKDVTIANKSLAKGKWRTLMNHMHQARLTELPSEQPDADWLWMDGGMWIVEINEAGRIVRLKRENEMELRLQRFVDAIVAVCSIPESSM